MFGFGKDHALYSELKTNLIQRAEIQCQQLDQSADDILVAAFRQANIGATGGAMSGTFRTQDRTPMELKPLLGIMLTLPPELSAWLILFHVEKALLNFDLPRQLQGDIMMAFECTNYVLPEKTIEGASVLAHSLCMMPSLRRARSALLNFGVPFTEKRLSEEEMLPLIKQGYLPEDVMTSTKRVMLRLGWNIEMRVAVVQELEKITPEASRLFQTDKVQKKELQTLRRWKRLPDPEADALLQRGIKDSDLDKAYDLLEKAGQVDPILLPDVLRNQAWILSKWKRYEEAVNLVIRRLISIQNMRKFGIIWAYAWRS
ncbi:MAG: hypothetical protein HS126_40020 [Anaerolineales bacterium]|nr:hypothetical protein [Anaerolineales bacterium]